MHAEKVHSLLGCFNLFINFQVLNGTESVLSIDFIYLLDVHVFLTYAVFYLSFLC